MTHEIELIQDGDGLAVLGAPQDVDAFLTAHGLQAVDMRPRWRGVHGQMAATALQGASEWAATSAKWLKLTDESALARKAFPMVRNAATGNLHATLRASNGQFVKNLQFVSPGASALALTNPATLAVAATMMSQMSLQQSIDELGDYLEIIDAKIDDILRAQKDAVLADMIGAELVIEEAMAVRTAVGRVSDVTWSKVQSTAMITASTQAYALRRLDTLAEKVEKSSVREMAAAAKDAEPAVREWLAVIARCVQLQDAAAVLELDRVLDSTPEDLLAHRQGLKKAREDRLATIHRATELLLERMNLVATRANAKVLLTPLPARAAVASSTKVSDEVIRFQVVLEIEDGHDSTAAKRWRTAVVEARDKAIAKSVHSAHAVKHGGDVAVDKVHEEAARLSGGVRAFRDAIRKPDTEATEDESQH